MTDKSSPKEYQTKIDQISKRLKNLRAAPYKASATHADSIIIDANQSFADLVGYTCDELKGLNAWVLFPPESYPILMEKLQSKSQEPYQLMAHDRLCKPFPIEMYGVNHNSHGELTRTVYVRDITLQLAAEQELEKASKALDTMASGTKA